MGFAIADPTTAKLASLNVRSEHHGDELVTAVDIKLRVMLPNLVLDSFSPGLCEALYMAGESAPHADTDGQGELSLPVSDRPALRFPQLASALKWDAELPACEILIDALGHSVALEAMKVGRFELEPNEGGSVLVTLTAQSTHYPGEERMGHLCAIVAHDVRLSIRPNPPDAL
jgi:hypothetical protein